MRATVTGKMIREPKITLVGAGPGDPELISLKAVRALSEADVVLYDALVDDQLLQYAPAHAVKVYVGKRSGDHTYSQEAVNKLMVDYALNYGHVVRLKGGDPFVFGRGYEELDHAASYSIPAQIIPGISSSISVPALAGIPVTHRGASESFWVITGTTAAGEVSGDLYTAAKSRATVVVLMGLKKIKEIADIFIAEGKGRLPVAVIQKGSMEDERVVVGVAATIAESVADKKIQAPAIIVFGEVVGLHPLFQPIIRSYEFAEEN
ncbi:MAG TPA: uroporphyrinogen-III C-methyltransferase [Sphingobacteriaceae bacterium]